MELTSLLYNMRHSEEQVLSFWQEGERGTLSKCRRTVLTSGETRECVTVTPNIPNGHVTWKGPGGSPQRSHPPPAPDFGRLVISMVFSNNFAPQQKLSPVTSACNWHRLFPVPVCVMGPLALCLTPSPHISHPAPSIPPYKSQ